MERADITGQRFGLLTAERYDSARRDWVCACDCGRTTFARITALRRGERVSCGCEQRRITGDAHRTHGRSGTPEYRTWSAMKRRCLNPRASQYAEYGGRGITICQRWIDSFASFLSDMGMKPSRKHSIERIDNDGNYEPSNCRWATVNEQVNNTRVVRRYVFRGRSDTASNLARRAGMAPALVKLRLNRGWTIDRALTVPAFDRGQHT